MKSSEIIGKTSLIILKLEKRVQQD